MAMRALLLAAVISPVLVASPAWAKDYGQVGTVFPVIEMDMMSVIENKLNALKASGRLDAMNAMFQKKADANVRRPPAVAGIDRATEARSWLFDPSVIIDHDIRDQKGNLIAPAGRRVNPLDFIVVKTPLVFFNGDDPEQMAWAVKHFDGTAKLIMVAGAPLDAMTAHQRRFYFDQGGRLTTRFGIHAVPAVVVQEGHAMRVNEIAKLKVGAGS